MAGERSGMERRVEADLTEKLSPPVARALAAFLEGRLSAGSFSAFLTSEPAPQSGRSALSARAGRLLPRPRTLI
jgi:hypothetical protein